jgi:molybdate transport system substrate-binding protein
MKKTLFIILFILSVSKLFSAEIVIYNAADLVYAMEELGDVYAKKYPQDKIKMVYGSSGKGFIQIINGAPYDITLMADMEYLHKLKEKGLVSSEIKPYAIGRIVIWKRKSSSLDLSKGISVILDPSIKKIAIANWDHAPYGVAAKECLEYYKMFDKVKDKFVLGENVSQTAQFIQTGAADIGFIALSISLGKKLREDGVYYLLPEKCHREIKQGYAILKNPTNDHQKFLLSKRFYDFITSKEARQIFIKYGFVLPGELNE